MRTQFVLSILAFAAAVSAQSSSSFITTPIDITGTNLSPPPATPTSIETQSPRPSLSAPESEAPTETFPSISDGPSSEAPTETMPTIVPSVTQPPVTGSLSSVIASASSALSSVSNSLTSRSASTVPASATPSPSQNAGVALQFGVAGWTVGAVLAGVVAGAALL
ncbi:hypothetical protein RSOLAG22IIIB_01162 [Rhizoctonia solani]|uniref:Uncharacterized protein n=1 Tax=Rhizoctonia solani TaxID=456999 RepID=A0A0K6G1V2_9AGAM|nr:unnamed protein product [Rhizoctonia solani]CUA72491.1 hypothetical protein RSOLAG22IIIB_01162 [Rhizoctonia solani]